MKRAGILILLIVACRRSEAPGTQTQTSTSKTVRVHTKTIPSDASGVKEKDLIRPTGRFLESAKLGAKLGTDGAVADEVLSVDAGQPVYLTLKLRESPPGLQTHAVWQDENGKALAKEIRQMNGAKMVTFSMTKPLAPGRYKVEAYWGGNLAADKTFDVVEAKKKR